MTEKSCCRGWDNKLLNIITHDRWSFSFWSLIFLIYKIKTKCQSHKCDILSWALYSLEIKGIFIASLTVHLSSQDNGEAQITQYNIHYYKVNIMVVSEGIFPFIIQKYFCPSKYPQPLLKNRTQSGDTNIEEFLKFINLEAEKHFAIIVCISTHFHVFKMYKQRCCKEKIQIFGVEFQLNKWGQCTVRSGDVIPLVIIPLIVCLS